MRIRLTEQDFNRLQEYARLKDIPMSQIIRDYIRRLPKQSRPEVRGFIPKISGKIFLFIIAQITTTRDKVTTGSKNFTEQVILGEILAQQEERMLMAISDNLSFAEAAAITEVFFTAYDALLAKGNFQAGDVVPIHAGGSGVATAAIGMESNQNFAKILLEIGK